MMLEASKQFRKLNLIHLVLTLLPITMVIAAHIYIRTLVLNQEGLLAFMVLPWEQHHLPQFEYIVRQVQIIQLSYWIFLPAIVGAWIRLRRTAGRTDSTTE